jgi:hypothetical protein
MRYGTRRKAFIEAHPDSSCFDGVRHPECFVDVLREDRASEAIDGVIGHFDYLYCFELSELDKK